MIGDEKKQNFGQNLNGLRAILPIRVNKGNMKDKMKNRFFDHDGDEVVEKFSGNMSYNYAETLPNEPSNSKVKALDAARNSF